MTPEQRGAEPLTEDEKRAAEIRAEIDALGDIDLRPMLVLQRLEIERLRANFAALEAWQREGDACFARDTGTIRSMFSLGAWWADRPWRRRDAK